MTKKMITEFLVGCAFGPVGFFVFGEIHDIITRGFRIEIFFGGDMAGASFGFLIGVPVAILTGISLFDRFIFESKGHNILGLVTGFVLTDLGTILGIFLLGRIGNKTILFSLPITSSLAVVGYNFKSLFMTYKWSLKYMLTLVIGFLLATIIFDMSVAHKSRQKQKVEVFIEQVITSVKNQTEFYKFRCVPEDVYKNLEKYSAKFSPKYKIIVTDYRIFGFGFGTGASYEAVIIFDNGEIFNVEGDIAMDHAMLSSIKPYKQKIK
jgi:hypothetical protein